MGFKTFVLKLAQAEARIWPGLAYLLQVRSTAVSQPPVETARPEPPHCNNHTQGYRSTVKNCPLILLTLKSET